MSATWAVTANHCLSAGVTHARFGSLDYSTGGELVEIADTVSGPDGADIGLVRLASPVSGAPVAIASVSPASGTVITLLGWGQTTPDRGGFPPSKVLKQLGTTVAQDSSCSSQGGNIDGPVDLCIESASDGTACYGDSGGPAIVDGALVGAASRSGSRTCGNTDTIYVDVTALAAWVQVTIAGTNPGGPPALPAPTVAPKWSRP